MKSFDELEVHHMNKNIIRIYFKMWNKCKDSYWNKSKYIEQICN